MQGSVCCAPLIGSNTRYIYGLLQRGKAEQVQGCVLAERCRRTKPALPVRTGRLCWRHSRSTSTLQLAMLSTSSAGKLSKYIVRPCVGGGLPHALPHFFDEHDSPLHRAVERASKQRPRLWRRQPCSLKKVGSAWGVQPSSTGPHLGTKKLRTSTELPVAQRDQAHRLGRDAEAVAPARPARPVHRPHAPRPGTTSVLSSLRWLSRRLSPCTAPARLCARAAKKACWSASESACLTCPRRNPSWL